MMNNEDLGSELAFANIFIHSRICRDDVRDVDGVFPKAFVLGILNQPIGSMRVSEAVV